MLKIFRQYWKDIAIIFLLSLVPLLWFRLGTVMVGHDLVAPLDPKVFFTGRWYTWIDQFYGQSQIFILGTILIHLIDAIPSYLGFSLQVSQKIVYVFWFFLIGLSAYTLAHTLKPSSRIFKLTATILYQFNFFILQGWWIAEKSKFSAYIAAPLVLSIFILVESGKMSLPVGVALNGLLLFFFNAGGLFGLPLYGGFMVAIACFLIFSLIDSWYRKNFVSVKKLVWLTLLSMIAAIAVNAYVLLPAVMKIRSQVGSGLAGIGGVSGIISWASEISANASFLNIMRLQGIPEWYDNPQHPYAKIFLSHPVLIAISFLWPIMAFASLYVIRTRDSRRYVLYFFFLYLMGMFFTSGTHPPLGFLYKMLVERVPGFFIFRSPYFKFAPGLYLAVSFLLAYVLDAIPRRFRKAGFIIFISIVLLYHYPFITGNFFEWRKGFSTRLTVPSYVFDYGTWVNTKTDNGRVLLLPPDSPDLQHSLYTWGYLSFQALPTLLSNRSVIVNNDKLNSSERILTMKLYDALLQGDTTTISQLSSILGITYVVAQKDAAPPSVSAISTEVEAYIRGLTKSELFVLEKQFGLWEVYRLKNHESPLLYAVTHPSLIDSNIDDSGIFLEYLTSTSNFVLKSDLGSSSSLSFDQTILVPQCLTCPSRNKPEIIFPERNILPGDPFYSLVLLSERVRSRPTDPKGIIYNTLGISLKRVSEINQMMFEKRVLTKEISDRYLGLLATIKDNFNVLPTLEDKINTARDVQQYLRAQRNYLRPNLGSSVTAGTQTVLAGTIFSALSEMDTMLSPFIAPLEDPNSRLYQIRSEKKESFRIFVRGDDVKAFSGDISMLRLTMDDTTYREVQLEKNMIGDWISLGTIVVDAGYHVLKLALPKEDETLYQLTPVITEFSLKGENSCYGATVADLEHDKLYRMRLRYLNDFSDNLILFTWEHAPDGMLRLISAVKLLAGPFEEKQEQLLEVASGASRMTLAVCAPNLTVERAAKQFTLQLDEVIYPSMIFTSSQNKAPSIEPVTYNRVNSTKYKAILDRNMQFPIVLVFPQRFDTWWQISGVEAQHIVFNGYANGWIIQTPPEGDVILEYKGQKYLIGGAFISFFAVILYIAILRRKFKKIN